MIFVYNDTCSKCADLSSQLADGGFSWNTIRYMDGELSEDLVDTIFGDCEGPRSDLIRTHEAAWIGGGLDVERADLADLKRFVMQHPIVLQRPIVVVDGRVVIARPPNVLMDILTEAHKSMEDYQQRVQEGFDKQAFMKHLGARLESVREGFCEISVPFSEALTQQHGFFHAGVTATLADNAGGFASYSLMAEDEQPLTVEFKINLLEKAVGERLIARATVLRNGRTLKVSNVEVFASQAGVETRIAIAITTVIATRIR